ncbi:MAG: asparagine synthase C-terminal domain-containing protein, partial [Patescibacteria group bacterium]|nr:asparagine synthase C-terminal domain-containing protein [Patescibacteria group bacterium]
YLSDLPWEDTFLLKLIFDPKKKLYLKNCHRQTPGKIGDLFQFASLPLSYRNQFWIASFSEPEIELLLGEKPDYSDLEEYDREFDGDNFLDKAFFLDQKLTLEGMYLPKVDRTSMQKSLEVRCPFLDISLIEFSAKIPAERKLKNFQTKALLKQLAKDCLPKEILNLPKKGFGIPLGEWLKDDWQFLIKRYFKEGIISQGMLNPEGVKKLLSRGSPSAVWKLLVYYLWQEEWLRN